MLMQIKQISKKKAPKIMVLIIFTQLHAIFLDFGDCIFF